MNPKIKLIMLVFQHVSNGTEYVAFRAIDTLTGKEAEGRISGDTSNIISAIHSLVGFYDNDYFMTVKECKSRDFDYYTKNFPYVGCLGEEISRAIKDQWNR